MYEIFEHTADFGIRARADNLGALFGEAAKGLFSLMVSDLATVRLQEQVELQLEADDIDGLFHDWLAELLYTFHSQRIVLGDFLVLVEGFRLSAIARGERIDHRQHEIDMEVKAITWHALRVEQENDHWLAEVIVDV